MTTINQLPLLDVLLPSAQFVVWSTGNGDSRRVPYNTVKADIINSVNQDWQSAAVTLTNKTINLSNNALIGTLAQFNTACTDADFASVATTQTLTNKTLALGSNTLSGTLAQFNTACTDADFQPTTFTPAGTGAVSRTVVSKLNETISVRDFGAVGDGVTDDTAAIQAAIDYAASVASPTYPYRGAVVTFPVGLNFRCNSTLTLKSGVMLFCPGSGRSGGASITGFGTTIIDTPVGVIDAVGIDGVSLFGGSSSVRVALRLRNSRKGVFTNFSINNVQEQGILCNAGVINAFDNILIVNALLDRTRSTPGGALETYDFDSMFSRLEITGAPGGVTTVSSSNLYCNAILAGGSNGFWSRCVGQFGDVGIRILGDFNHFVNCRADTTMGHGIIDDGSSNIVSASEVLNWAMDTTADQYDAYQNFSQNGIVNGLVIAKSGGSRGRYGINLNAYTEVGTRTSVTAVVFTSGSPNVIARYNVPTVANGVPSVALASSGYITDQGTSTTIDLSRAATMRLLPASAVSYTDVINAVPGQIYTFILNSNATLVHNSSKIITKDGTNITGGAFTAVWVVVQFIAYQPTVIREIGR
jgi:hypothetical protein